MDIFDEKDVKPIHHIREHEHPAAQCKGEQQQPGMTEKEITEQQTHAVPSLFLPALPSPASRFFLDWRKRRSHSSAWGIRS